MFIGQIDWFEAFKMAIFSVVVTIILQSMQRKTFVRLRYIYVVLIIEFAGINGYGLLVNENRVEQLYGHSLIMFAVQIYCQVMPKLTADIVESVWFGEMLPS